MIPRNEQSGEYGPHNDRRKRRSRVNPEWLAVVIGLISLISTLGGWLWWGGRLSARVEQLEQFQAATANTAQLANATDTRQTAEIAVNSAQFNLILGQLNRLEGKIDSVKVAVR